MASRLQWIKNKDLCDIETIRRVLGKVDFKDNGSGLHDERLEVEAGGVCSYDEPMAFISLGEGRSVYVDNEGYGFCDVEKGDLNGDAPLDDEPCLDEIRALLNLDHWVLQMAVQWGCLD